MRLLRTALIQYMRDNTAAGDRKGARQVVIGALSLVAPDAELRRRMARCGKRNPRNDSREFCERSACPYCMERRAAWLYLDRLLPALKNTPSDQLRWITVLMHRHTDLDAGAAEMNRQERRLRHVVKRVAGGTGKNRKFPMRIWGAKEVERDGDGWLFHVHMLVDLAGVEANVLAARLRATWGQGERQVQVKPLQVDRHHYGNLYRLASYMTKARYTSAVDGRRLWLPNEQIASVALWRDRLPGQWSRFTVGVRV